MDALRRASAFLFYLLGALLIVTVLLVRRGMMPVSLLPAVYSLDLPLLLVAMLFGGSSLYVSLTKGRTSIVLMTVIFLPLFLVFGFFCYLNFAPPLVVL